VTIPLPFPPEEPDTSVEGRPAKTGQAHHKPVHHAPPKARHMELILVNHSKHLELTRPELTLWASALEDQSFQHYAPFWQSQGVKTSLIDEGKTEADLTFDQVPLVIFDEPDQAGALGYHSITPSGKVYGRVFVKPILDNGGTLKTGGNSITCTLSHEALETVGDPYANFWADMDGETEDSLELCDRVEADSYDMNGIAVSNFLGPRAFRDGPGPYDWMRLLKSPFEIRPGGYAIRRTGGPNGKYDNQWGAAYPEHKKALKAHDTARTAKRTPKHPAKAGQATA